MNAPITAGVRELALQTGNAGEKLSHMRAQGWPVLFGELPAATALSPSVEPVPDSPLRASIAFRKEKAA